YGEKRKNEISHHPHQPQRLVGSQLPFVFFDFCLQATYSISSDERRYPTQNDGSFTSSFSYSSTLLF
ncbi:TPA: hypothetical protein ACH9RA_005301, partial [Escherichia coli]